MITERQLLTLKEKAEEGAKKLLEAEATMKEVKKQLEAEEKKLKDKGVENAQEYIDEKEKEIEKLYNEAKSLLEGDNNAK